jgi:hypothetical protein
LVFLYLIEADHFLLSKSLLESSVDFLNPLLEDLIELPKTIDYSAGGGLLDAQQSRSVGSGEVLLLNHGN